MSQNYYITGGAGFIGRHFNMLLNNVKCINIDLRENIIVPNQIKGDIRNIEDIRNSICDSDIIIHLAASHYDFEKDYYTTNVGGTKNLLKVATEKDIKNFIFYSSVAVYGSREYPSDEETIPEPENDYGKSKLEAEKILEQWVKNDPTRKVLIIRPAVVFGEFNYGNIFNLMRNIDRGFNFHIGGKPVVKSIAYVKNLVNATQYLFENMESNHEIYNYSDEPHLTNFEISNTISKSLNNRKSITLPYPFAIILGQFFDLVGKTVEKEFMISVKRVKKYCTPTHFKAEKVLEGGFKPDYPTDKGLEKTVEWFDNNRDIWSKEYDFLKQLFESNYGITIE